MQVLGKISAATAIAVAAALVTAPALTGEPLQSQRPATPQPQNSVKIRLPSGAVITIPVEPTTPTPHGPSGDHMVGEGLC